MGCAHQPNSGYPSTTRVLTPICGGTPPQIGVSTRVVEGYPLFGWWAQPINGWDDKNKDGLLTYNANAALNEVFVGDSAIFRGYTQPRHIVTATPGFEFLNRRLRIQALF